MENNIRTLVPHQQFDNQQLDLIRKTVAKGTTPEQFLLFVEVCKHYRLNPMARQIYAVVRGGQMTIQTSIDGFRLMAERTGKYAGQLGPHWCGEDGEWHDVWLKKEPPVAARVGILRSDFKEPLWGVARYSSYAQLGSPTWTKMPDVMLAKCLPYRAEIETDMGTIRIGEIVRLRLPVKVRSLDEETGQIVWKPVVNYFYNGGTTEWIKIWVPNGTKGNRNIRLTPEHPVLTEAGWKPAGEITTDDTVAVSSPVLSPDQEQVLIGSLLGDGSLCGRKQGANLPHYSESHSLKQSEYLEWKLRAFANLDPTIRVSSVKVKGTEHGVVKLLTKSAPALLAYGKMFYSDGVKSVHSDALDRLGDLGVAVWIMDDGALRRDYRWGTTSPSLNLYSCCFSTDEQEALQAFFTRRYGVTPIIRRAEKNPYLWFSTKDTAILLQQLAGYITFDIENNKKVWIAQDIAIGSTEGIAYVPVRKVEVYTSYKREGRELPEPEGRYDIEVADTHNFLYNNIVVHNCAESLAFRRAFPAEMSGLYTSEEMEQAGNEPAMHSYALQEITEDETIKAANDGLFKAALKAKQRALSLDIIKNDEEWEALLDLLQITEFASGADIAKLNGKLTEFEKKQKSA